MRHQSPDIGLRMNGTHPLPCRGAFKEVQYQLLRCVRAAVRVIYIIYITYISALPDNQPARILGNRRVSPPKLAKRSKQSSKPGA